MSVVLGWGLYEATYLEVPKEEALCTVESASVGGFFTAPLHLGAQKASL